MGAAKRVLRYLKYTQDLRLTYNRHTKNGNGDFHGYSDAD